MQIPEEKVQEVLQAADIVDVVSKFVRLKKSGANYTGLCPFHSEKTPSFSVSPKKQIYNCFGCHKGGNSIKFLMDYSNLSFLDAVKELAREYGVDLPAQDEKTNEEQKRFEEYYDLTKATIRFFIQQLTENPENKHILEYLKNRHINDSSIKNFGLGYAPGARGKLIDYYKKGGYDPKKAIELGFLGESDGKIYERFAGRLIFPIFSHHGREIGAGGRILEKRTDTGKYINSPESPIYNKSRVLYGLSHSKDEIRRLDHVIVVEGYLDVISLFQNGIKNIAAVSGTALTDEQVKLLSSYTKNIYLLFDSDPAGYKAAMRSIEVVLKHNLNLMIMSLPEGEDPDSFVHKRGAKEFLEFVKNAKEFIDYQYMSFEKGGWFSNPDKMTEAIKEMVRPVALIPEELRRTILVKKIAEKFNLRERVLEEEIDKIKTRELETRHLEVRERKFQTGETRGDSRPAIVKIDESISHQTKTATELNEIELIRLMFEGDERVLQFIFQFIRPEEYTVPIHYGIAEKVYEEIENGTIPSVKNLHGRYDEEEQAYILDIALEKHRISEHLEDLLPTNPAAALSIFTIDSVKKFRLLRIDQAIKDIQADIARTSDQLKTGELAIDLRTCMEEKKDINRIMEEIKADLIP
ncbi:DNA primase [Ignavibacteriales bacterium]